MFPRVHAPAVAWPWQTVLYCDDALLRVLRREMHDADAALPRRCRARASRPSHLISVGGTVHENDLEPTKFVWAWQDHGCNLHAISRDVWILLLLLYVCVSRGHAHAARVKDN